MAHLKEMFSIDSIGSVVIKGGVFAYLNLRK